MFTIYVLKSLSFLKSYVGMTIDIERRILEHNSGKHPYTRRYLPWVIVLRESYSTREEARSREKYLKSAAGRRFLKVVFKSNA